MESALQLHNVLYEHLGDSVRDHFEPIALWTGQVDLDEVRVVDAYRPICKVPYPRYLVRRVELPNWLDVGEWIENHEPWSLTWGAGAATSWPEPWQRFLAQSAASYRRRTRFTIETHSHSQRLALIELLSTTTFRSEFRRSLRSQAEAWLSTWWSFENGRGPAPRFISPFSTRQWNRLVRPHHESAARRLGLELGDFGDEIDDEKAYALLASTAA